MTFRILGGILMVLASFKVTSQSLVLTNQDYVSIKDHVRHFRDATGSLTLEQIKQREIPWQTKEALNYGFDNAAHWFVIPVTNRTETEDWLLEIAFSPLDKIDFFINADSGWVHKTAGDLFPIEIRDLRHPHVIFLFPLEKDKEQTIYLRVESTSSIQVPAILWKRDVFFTKSNTLQIINGLFYGAMLVMILYQLFLFTTKRDSLTLYYVFTLVAMIHVVSFFQGYSFLYLYPKHPELNHIMAVITGPLFLLFSTGLTREFLNLKVNNPWLDKLLIINTGLDILVALFMISFLDEVSYRFHHYAILMHCMLALSAAGYCLYKKFKPALYYLLSWISLLIATLIFSMSNLGIFADYLNTNSTSLIMACLSQMLLISFALGNRWNMMVKENQLAKEHELQRGQEEKERLEKEVQLRLEEINHKNQKLEEVNQVKDKLFSIVSHDIKGPLTSLQLALSLTKKGMINQQEFRQLADALETRFNQTSEFIENLLQWATLQLRGETFAPTKVDINDLITQTLSLLDFEITNKNILIENHATSVIAYADVTMVKSILRNLLTNAIKFTRAGGSIKISTAKDSADFILVSVSDTGVGIPLKNQPLIFSLDIVTTPGTGQEKGTGLGLLLCKEFAERNRGKIWFETEEGKGTTFYFTLPFY